MIYTYKDYYTIETDDRSVKINGNNVPLKRRLFLSFGNQVLLDKTSEELKQISKLEIKALGGELWPSVADFLNDAVVGIDRDQVAYMLDGMDKRTRVYLEAVKKNIGLEEVLSGEVLPDIDVTKEYSLGYIWGNASPVECGKDNDGKWWATFGYRADIDVAIEERYQFDRKPTKHKVLTARLIDNIETKFAIHTMVPVFRCWECGLETHWLNVDGNLEKKWENFKGLYCGC